MVDMKIVCFLEHTFPLIYNQLVVLLCTAYQAPRPAGLMTFSAASVNHRDLDKEGKTRIKNNLKQIWNRFQIFKDGKCPRMIREKRYLVPSALGFCTQICQET